MKYMETSTISFYLLFCVFSLNNAFAEDVKPPYKADPHPSYEPTTTTSSSRPETSTESCKSNDTCSCESDKDCVLVDKSCCGCQSGGKSIAIHKSLKGAHNKALKDRCEPLNVVCAAWYRCGEFQAKCKNSRCVTIQAR